MSNNKVKLSRQSNRSGNSRLAKQGFGRLSDNPPRIFDPERDQLKADEFFAENGFVVLKQCLDTTELTHLNEFIDRTQIEKADAWGLAGKRKAHHLTQGLVYLQPLLDYPELDPYTQHHKTYPFVSRFLGGEEAVRFSEFNFREIPPNAGFGAMNFHHDEVKRDRFFRKPYLPCDWLGAIHYLTDVTLTHPALCVVPRSQKYNTLAEAHDQMGSEYREVPIYAPAGCCILYDTALLHTRLDGDGQKMRRTWHQYYARGGWSLSTNRSGAYYLREPSKVLSDWVLIPERLACHENPDKRRYYSHWNVVQCEWVTSGFDPKIRKLMPLGES